MGTVVELHVVVDDDATCAEVSGPSAGGERARPAGRQLLGGPNNGHQAVLFQWLQWLQWLLGRLGRLGFSCGFDVRILRTQNK